MSNRDALAALIAKHHDAFFGVEYAEPATQDFGLADGLLAAGYRKLPLPVHGFPAHPTNSGRGNEQDRSNGSQPQQPLHHNTNHGQNQPKSQQNNHQGSHAQSLRPTPDEWNGAGIAPETIEAAARAWAIHDETDGCFERVDAWEALEDWEREAYPDEYPGSDYEDSADYRERATAALTAAAPIIQAEERARVIQAVHDAAELEPEERDGPHLLVEAALWVTVEQLNNLHGIQDGMDWIRYTATDYANKIAQAKAEALREAAEHITDDYLKRALLARAATIEGKSE